MQFVDEQDDILGPADLIHHRLDPFLELPAILGAGHHESQVEGDDALFPKQFRDVALGDFLGESFDNGGLADAGFTEQHRIVFGAAAEDLDDALDFALAPDHRIHVALAGDLREIAAEGLERGSLDFPLLLGGRLFGSFRNCALFLRVEVGIQFLQNFLPGLLDVDIEVFEDAGGNSVPFAEQAEQNVLRADVGVVERLGFLSRQRQDLLDPGGVGDVADHFLIRPGAHLFFDFHADGLQVEAHLLKHVDGNALTELDEAKQEMFGADKVVIEAVGFFARQREHLLRAGREIVHGFIAHTLNNRCTS